VDFVAGAAGTSTGPAGALVDVSVVQENHAAVEAERRNSKF